MTLLRAARDTSARPAEAASQARRLPKSETPDFRRRWVWAQGGIAFAAILALFLWIQFASPNICCGDFDGYYHIHWSQLLAHGIWHGRLPAFPWLPLTVLSAQTYADQHLLFHLSLIPFLWIATPVTAAKMSAALFGTAAVFSCFWLTLRFRLRYAAFWLIALAGSSSFFLYRMSMTRAQSVSLVLAIVGVFLLFEERYRWLALLAFVYVWTYNLFVILAVMALLWTVVLWWSEGRREFRPLMWAGIGIIAGLIVNPYFPKNIFLLAENLIAKAGTLSIQSGGGMEWYALPTWKLATSSTVALAAMLAGYLAVGFLAGRGGRSGTGRPLFLLLLASLLLLLTARSRRFTEYWPPCAVLFAAFSLQAVWDAPAEAEQSGRSKEASRRNEGRRSRMLFTLALLAVVANFGYQAYQARLMVVATMSADKYRGGAQWLRDHVPPGGTIFNTVWEDFPVLFYYDDAHSYVSGLDPVYLADRNPQLGTLYDRIVAGKENHPGARVHDEFGSEYVFLTQETEHNFYVSAMLSGQFEKVYEDSYCVILRVKDSVQ